MKKNFVMRYIKLPSGAIFDIVDVPGDGNCFFHAVVLSDEINLSSHDDLRGDLVKRLRTAMVNPEEKSFIEKLYIASDPLISLNQWLDSIARTGAWGGDIAALFLGYFYQINFCIVNNSKHGLTVLNIREWIGRLTSFEYVSDNAPSIFLYHHLFRRPWEGSLNCNHFALMREVMNIDHIESKDIYVGTECLENVPFDMSSGEEEEKKSTKVENKSSQTFMTLWTGSDSQGPAKKAKKQLGKKLREEGVRAAKAKKQSVLNSWVIESNPKEAEELAILNEVGRKIHHDSYNRLPIEPGDAISSTSIPINAAAFRKGNKSLTWNQRASLIFMFLHEDIRTEKSTRLFANQFSLKARTFDPWVQNPRFIRTWLPIVKRLDFNSVSKLQDLPNGVTFNSVDNPPLSKKTLEFYEKKISSLQTVIVAGRSGFRAEVEKGNRNGLFLPKNAIRVRSKKKIAKNCDIESWIKDLVNIAWKNGMPISKSQLASELKKKYLSTSGQFYESYLNSGDDTKLNIFIGRALEKCGYVSRKTTFSQKIPIDWRKNAEEGAKRVRDRFKSEKVDVIISADETFLKFHEQSFPVLAPRGTKRIGRAVKIDEKVGCTVMVSMDMYGSFLPRPFIIFTGGLGANLMKKWQTYTRSVVLFTESHWMTSETNILYFQYLRQCYPDKRIGLVYDNAPSHISKQVTDWIDDYNSRSNYQNQFLVELIDPCLTSIYQPPDVVMNAPLKTKIRKLYQSHIRNLCLADNGIKAGDNVKITREQLVSFRGVCL